MTHDDLKQRFIEKLKSGENFTLRECSICNFPLRFFSQNGNIYFDPSCDCTRGFGPELRDWSSLDFYFDPSNGWIDKIKEFCKP